MELIQIDAVKIEEGAVVVSSDFGEYYVDTDTDGVLEYNYDEMKEVFELTDQEMEYIDKVFYKR